MDFLNDEHYSEKLNSQLEDLAQLANSLQQGNLWLFFVISKEAGKKFAAKPSIFFKKHCKTIQDILSSKQKQNWLRMMNLNRIIKDLEKIPAPSKDDALLVEDFFCQYLESFEPKTLDLRKIKDSDFVQEEVEFITEISICAQNSVALNDEQLENLRKFYNGWESTNDYLLEFVFGVSIFHAKNNQQFSLRNLLTVATSLHAQCKNSERHSAKLQQFRDLDLELYKSMQNSEIETKQVYCDYFLKSQSYSEQDKYAFVQELYNRKGETAEVSA